MALLLRSALTAELKRKLRANVVVALLGPRQSGKTTLARAAVAGGPRENFFDLEDPRDARRLEQPMLALERLRGTIVIDEVQRAPELFSVLRVLADRRPRRARFLVLGSASPDLLRQSSETLAGRIAFVEMAGFDLDEVSPQKWRRLLLRGGFPPSFLARSDGASFEWREAFVRTFIERDLAALNVEVRSRDNVRRLWSMLAHRHAQLWNGAEIAGALGETYPTVKRHLDILRGALVVRQLPPFLPNAEKRLVKAHKVYIRDSGVLHALLDIRSLAALEGHPQLGAAWEGFVVEEVVRRVGERAAFFWGTHGGAELDLLVVRGRSRVGFEMKWGDAPKATKSMYAALADLNLKNLHVIYPGDVRYPLAPRIDVVPITMLDEVL